MVLHLFQADLLGINRLRLLKPYQLLEQFVLAGVKADLGEGLLGELLRVAHLEAVFHLGRVGRAVHQLQDLVSCLLALLVQGLSVEVAQLTEALFVRPDHLRKLVSVVGARMDGDAHGQVFKTYVMRELT